MVEDAGIMPFTQREMVRRFVRATLIWRSSSKIEARLWAICESRSSDWLVVSLGTNGARRAVLMPSILNIFEDVRGKKSQCWRV